MAQSTNLKAGSSSKTTPYATISVDLSLEDVSDGRSKKIIQVSYQPNKGPKRQEKLTPKRGSNTSQALAQHITDWLMGTCNVEYGNAKKLAWAVARDFEA